eukprot:TRINITY_DN4546_c0_g1_i5.p1 TRINITY_DN4546_c0_g1~~TRINITY_DN4546_c0_g1_i5.p1  ORF type:complete len:156 (+),score=10.33 TRINITY_DN4546_c0_g1_i5:285-752(+)
MTIIKNKNLPNDKIVFVAFSELKGMGRTRGLNISHIWGFSKKVNMKYITDWYHKALSLIPPRYYVMEEKLGQIHQANINMLLITKSYKSFRYQFSLPLRGQRTKTNAKTSKHHRELKLIQDKIEMRGDVVEGLSKREMKKPVSYTHLTLPTIYSV